MFFPQLLELLARETALMKDRQVLAREVEFLRKHLTAKDTKTFERLLSTHHTMVDDILVQVRTDGVNAIKNEVIKEVRGVKADLEDFDDLAKDDGVEKFLTSSSDITIDDVLAELSEWRVVQQHNVIIFSAYYTVKTWLITIHCCFNSSMTKSKYIAVQILRDLLLGIY